MIDDEPRVGLVEVELIAGLGEVVCEDFKLLWFELLGLGRGDFERSGQLDLGLGRQLLPEASLLGFPLRPRLGVEKALGLLGGDGLGRLCGELHLVELLAEAVEFGRELRTQGRTHRGDSVVELPG